MAINTAVLNTVYNHYMTNYERKSSPYDAHKKNELRDLYNSIVKINTNSPVYMFKNDASTRSYVIDVKENARSLHNTIAALGGLDEDTLLNQKTAYSSNSNIASVRLLDNMPVSDNFSPDTTVDIEVENLASGQKNLGNFLPFAKIKLAPDTYSFDIGVGDLNYEFQFAVRLDSTNQDIQQKLANLINKSNIGIDASVISDGENNSALQLVSHSTGVPQGKDLLFHISDRHTSKSSGAVSYLGIDTVASPPTDASFSVNGDEKHYRSNTFVLQDTYVVTLNGVSPLKGTKTTIGLANDMESLTSNVRRLFTGYNSFLQKAAEYSENGRQGAGQLAREIEHIALGFRPYLDSFGLQITPGGIINIDENRLRETANSEDSPLMLSQIKNLTRSLLQKADDVTLNPMNYVDRRIVAYKKPGHNFAIPYMTNAYSGMMFDNYC